MYIQRTLEKTINKHLKNKEILAVIGPRQCGKTTMITNIIKTLKNSKTITFDDIDALSLFQEDINAFAKLYVEPYNYLFIDEIQYAKDSGKKLKYLYDKYNTKIIISGSSAANIAIQSLKYLVGRIFIFELYPFSFKEYMNAKNKTLSSIIQEQTEFSKELEQKINKHLKEFIIFGGYPRIILSKTNEEKTTILKNLYGTLILREIKELFDLKDDFKLLNLMKLLSLKTSNILNYSEISKTITTPYAQLKEHLNILEKSFIIEQLHSYHLNKKTEIIKLPKVFFIDNGIRNSIINNFTDERTDIGALYENYAYTELIKQDIKPKYWRTKSGAEVDFIIEYNGNTYPIEIKTNLSNITRSFTSFIEKYKPKKAFIFSLHQEQTTKINNTTIYKLPLFQLQNIKQYLD